MNLYLDTWGCPHANGRDEITGTQNNPTETSAKAVSQRSTSAGEQKADTKRLLESKGVFI